MEFEVGMRVLSKSRVGHDDLSNQIGTIIWSSPSSDYVGIEFDNDINGHSGTDSRYTGKSKHCWNVYKSKLKPLIATPDQAFEQYINGHITEEAYREAVAKHET